MMILDLPLRGLQKVKITTAHASSSYGGSYTPFYAINNVISKRGSEFYHTKTNKRDEWFYVDLGRPYPISKVQITDR